MTVSSLRFAENSVTIPLANVLPLQRAHSHTRIRNRIEPTKPARSFLAIPTTLSPTQGTLDLFRRRGLRWSSAPNRRCRYMRDTCMEGSRESGTQVWSMIWLQIRPFEVGKRATSVAFLYTITEGTLVERGNVETCTDKSKN